MKSIEVVAAVILDNNRQILCTKRAPGGPAGGRWEFPGGKVEVNEEPKEALKREILEELNLSICVVDYLMTVEHDYPQFRVVMSAYLCKIVEETAALELKEHEDFLWVSVANLARLDWAPADIPIVEELGGQIGGEIVFEKVNRKQIEQAIVASFVDDQVDSDETMQAKLLTNDAQNNKVLTSLSKELVRCDTFMFSVAFITTGGLTMLLDTFKRLKKRRVKGRILTSTYQYFNTPQVFRRLLKLEDVFEVRIYDEKSFHAKGYIFKYEKDEKSNFIVGSSNLTQHALTYNHEWNVKVNSTFQGALIKDLEREFNATWERSKILTEDWIEQYEAAYQDSKIVDINQILKLQKTRGIKPNKMQREALESLKRLRNEGKDRAVLISATGTGKTYLSAFDVMDVQPRRFLFVIHRENVARAAMKTYQIVLGEEKRMGILSGTSRLGSLEADYVFATIQTLSKDRQLERFAPDHFDYIVIDEVHHAGASTYQKILEHFKPKFLLGMSATPERNDDINVLEMFDYEIAYEIRLQHAMKYELLAPFHYFGVQELEVDGHAIDDLSTFARLTHDDRIDHIIENIEYYGYSGNRPRGLIFCRQIEEARALSEKFNQRGYRTLALTGADSEETRIIAIDRLEQYRYENGLDYLFTVDIFNEGVDIPKVNQIVMLRPTQSSIIFIQQLGRGLRKADEKDYVVVLDFIGNYQNNYMIPIALSGDRTYNKDRLRRFAMEGSQMIPGCSTVNFDEVTQSRIFESINSARFSKVRMIKKEYHYLKQLVGRIPTLKDFYEHGAIDPMLIHEKCKSYHAFLSKYESEYKVHFSDEQEAFLKFISIEIANAKRPHEWMLIEDLLHHRSIRRNDYVAHLESELGLSDEKASTTSAIAFLSGGFLNKNQWKAYQNLHLVEENDGMINRTRDFENALGDETFRAAVMDLIEFTRLKYHAEYRTRYDETHFVLYEKYSRKDVCRLLNWEKEESNVIFGYKIEDITLPIFVTYDKKENINEGIKYEDEFINRHFFKWMTKNNRTMLSNEAVQIKNQEKNGLQIHLFVKKSDDEGSDHYYLGKMKKVKMFERKTLAEVRGQMKEVPIVEVRYAFAEPVREDIYDYLVSGLPEAELTRVVG